MCFKITKYDLITGRDLLEDLNILLDFRKPTITQGEVSIPIRDSVITLEERYLIQEGEVLLEASSHMKRIQNAKYDAVAPEDIVAACDPFKERGKRGTPDLTPKTL